jgi:uroporphyrinogen-III synthase
MPVRMTTRMADASGVTVVVTRPAHQAESLCRAIEQAGGTALRFPVIEIAPVADAQYLHQQLTHLCDYHLLIFVSANAVNFLDSALSKTEHWPSTPAIAAIGAATKKALLEKSVAVNYLAPQPFNSEALLSLAELQTMRGQRVMIIRGNGGREFLAKTLRERGATVDYLECYQRLKAKTDPRLLYDNWDKNNSMLIVVTSNEGLLNLKAMVDKNYQPKLLSSPLIVVSQRIADKAIEIGFRQRPQVTSSASNEAIFSEIKNWIRL